MVNKNPYENDETVDIPDFAKKAKEEDIDMSVFKLPKNDKSEEDYDDEEYYDDEYDDGPKVSKAAIIIGIVVVVLLAAAAIFGFVWGSNQKKAAAAALQQVETLKTENAALTTKVTELQTQITELQKKQSGTTTGDATTSKNYTIAVDSVNLRAGAGTEYDYVDYSDLDDTLAKVASESEEGTAYLVKGANITVLETKTNGSDTWGKLADEVWVCLKQGTTDFATAK